MVELREAWAASSRRVPRASGRRRPATAGSPPRSTPTTRDADPRHGGHRRRGAVPRRRRARHRPHRVLAVQRRPRRRRQRPGPGHRRRPGPQPLARPTSSPRTRSAASASPSCPIIHDIDDAVAEMRPGGRRSGLRAMLIPTRGSTSPPTTTRSTSRCGRSAEDLGLVVHTHSGGRPRTSGSGPGMVPIYATEAWLVGGPPAVGAALGRRVRPPPEPAVLDRRERRLVAARHRRAHGREVGRRPQHPQVRQPVPRGAVDASRASTSARNCFLGASTPSRRRDRPRGTDRPRQPAVGQRLPPPRGHVARTPATRSTTCSTTCPVDETAPMLGLTAAEVYGFDIDKLAGPGRAHRPHPRRGARHDRSRSRARPARRPTPSAPSRRRSSTEWDVRRAARCRGTPALLDPADAAAPGAHREPTGSRSRSPTAGSSSPSPATSTPGEVRALHYFGRDLVLFRDRRRRARAGRRLLRRTSAPTSAVGGKVEGDCMRCPFHGWALRRRHRASASRSPTAACERIPAKARSGSYPTHRAQAA